MNNSKKPARVSEIVVNDINTWKNHIFLTFDIDWAHDEILKDTIDLIENAGIAATWFVTHDTPVLTRLRENPAFELGIHPNFNFLLQGDTRNGHNAKHIVQRIKKIVPEAKSVRSHSVTTGGVIMSAFAEVGLSHESNDNVPEHSNISLKPWLGSYGMVKVPYCWADKHSWMSEQSSEFSSILNRIRLGVFDFHPIHIFLNTESMNRYEHTRPLHHKPKELIKHRFEGYGTRNRLQDLLFLANSS